MRWTAIVLVGVVMMGCEKEVKKANSELKKTFIQRARACRTALRLSYTATPIRGHSRGVAFEVDSARSTLSLLTGKEKIDANYVMVQITVASLVTAVYSTQVQLYLGSGWSPNSRNDLDAIAAAQIDAREAVDHLNQIIYIYEQNGNVQDFLKKIERNS